MSETDRPSLSNDAYYSLLHKFRVPKGGDFTHTSLGQPFGRFYIPHDHQQTFYNAYKAALRNGLDIHMTEKHRHISPVCIDLDFRFNMNQAQRQYNTVHLENFIKMYVSALKDWVVLPNAVTIYIMEKSSPRVVGDIVKDGVHIMIPDIITKPFVQLKVREACLQNFQTMLDKMLCISEAGDVFDEAVIEKNNWMMYGSKKPDSEPYRVTYTAVYTTDESLTMTPVYDVDDDWTTFVEILSLRNKTAESPIHEAKQAEITKHYEEVCERAANANARKVVCGTDPTSAVKNEYDDLEQVVKMLNLLDPKKATVYNDWIRLGWCLRNIDHRLLSAWDEFSKKSNKYKPGECERHWSHMKLGGLGIGTLHMWAKQDNPDGYAAVIQDSIRELVMQSLSGTHHDVAKVMHAMFKHEFVCSSIRNKSWYIFRGHRWYYSDSGYNLRARISNEVWKQFTQVSIWQQNRAMEASGQSDQIRHQEQSKKITEVAQKLKVTSFKDNVMKECSELFYVENFVEKLDSRINLIGFENGVYDLDESEFRDGRPDDYLTFSTKINYLPYRADDPLYDEIHTYLAQVFTNADVREYVIKLFATFLHGAIKDQKFYIWTGSGSNSKSKIVELFEKGFGDYCCKLPITLLTQKRAASNAANSEVARAKGKRFACLQEPSEDEKLNVGLMKELSGGDKVLARALYQEPFEFSPQFKMILCCNHLPHVPSDDGGTWRRIRVVEFTSRFVENPAEGNPNEFPMDLELSDKLERWKAHFMSMLIAYHKQVTDEGIHEPDEVTRVTREYKNQNDHIALFMHEYIEAHETSVLSLNDLFSEFKAWVKTDCNSTVKIPNKNELEKSVAKILNAQTATANASKAFKGFRFKLAKPDDIEII